MSDIVDACCHLFIWLGLLEAGACVRSPESLAPLWLKLIAGPTFMITILLLVLFEDLYIRPKMRLPLESVSQPAAPKSRRRYQPRRPGFGIQVETAADREQPLLERDKIRLVICDHTAEQHEVCYRLLKSCPLKGLVQFHYRSLGRAVSDEDISQYILRRQTKIDPTERQLSKVIQQGDTLRLDKAPRQQGLHDLDRLEIRLDYKSLYESYSSVLWRTKMRFAGELEKEINRNNDLSNQLRISLEQLANQVLKQSLLSKTIEEQKIEIQHLQEYRIAAKEAKTSIAKIEVLYALESSSRSRLEKELQNVQYQLFDANAKLQQAQADSEREISSKTVLLDQMKLELEAVDADHERLLQQISVLKADKDKTWKLLSAKKEELKTVQKQLCDTETLNEKVSMELEDLRKTMKNLEASNSSLQLQLHDHLQRKDIEIRPGALICRPNSAMKKPTNTFESSPPTPEWIRTTARSLPGIQAPLLIIDDGGNNAEEPRPYHRLDSRNDWRCAQ